MKVLIAILSCYSLRHCEQAVRDTWIKEIPTGVDYKFFLGQRTGVHDASVRLSEDEIYLDVNDDFNGVTKKTVEIYRWALGQQYDFVFKCDLDTLVRPKLLLESGFETFDWVGGQNSFFASGGAGYGLSKKAMEYVVEVEGAPGYEEDVHIARILLSHGIPLHNDPRYLFVPGAKMDDSTITYHLSSIREWYFKGYKPEMLLEAWTDQKARNYRAYTHPQPEQKRRFKRK
jgi:hypothetical protein